jgi:PilZ domain
MKVAASDRRLFLRHNFKTALRIRLWKSPAPEQRSESVNLSERGLLFATDLPMSIGTVVEVLFKMPEQITGEPTTEWLCSGHVVRVAPIDSPQGKLGVGVQFDCYQVTRKLEAESISSCSE